MTELADRIEKLHGKATPGPYLVQGNGKGKRRLACAPDGKGHQHTLCSVPHHNSNCHAELIGHLLNNVPQIVAALRGHGESVPEAKAK